MSNISISVEVKAPELAVAIMALAGALGGNYQVPIVQKPADAPKKEKNAENKSDPAPASEPNTTSETTDTEEIPTVVDLRAKAQEKGKTPEGKTAIKELLNKFESKSISEVPEEKRAAFLAALGEL